MNARGNRGRFRPLRGAGGRFTNEDVEPERLERLRAELAATVPFGYPTSGDPNLIGEHEVAPVRCGHCHGIIPWKIIKGWRD